jgi:hypothetical protein
VQLCKEIRKWRITSIERLASLPPFPQAYKLIEGCGIGHCEIKTAGHRLVWSVFSLLPLAGVNDGKILVRGELGLLFRHELQSINFAERFDNIRD